MRAALPLALALATPAMAQDHSAHQHNENAQAPQTSATAPQTDAMDHCAMGHLPPEQCPPPRGQVPQDHVGHSGMDHAGMDHSAMDHSGHTMPANSPASGAAPESAVPPRALEGPRHAADGVWGADAMQPSREENRRMHGSMTTGMVMVERLEARIPVSGGKAGWLWDGAAWHGGDIDRFMLKSEGESAGGSIEDAEVQALWSHAVAPYFDLQAGLRLDLEPETRSHLALGIQGLAPLMWHVDLAVFLSDRGEATARFEGEYDQKITQRLILQPRIELEMAAQDIPRRDIGAGLTKIEAGLRLRDEFVREFAPYLGLEYEAKLGETADIARARGDDPSGWKLLTGIRAWF